MSEKSRKSTIVKIYTLFLILFILFTLSTKAQPCQQKEIKVVYSNGMEVFNICTSNPTFIFDDEKEYYWYTEYSKIKTTKGGCGGKLLNGNYKFYDQFGNLREEKNYTLGLKDKNATTWDSLGNIQSKSIYDNDKLIYWKFINDEGFWVEFIGELFKEGTTRRVLTKFGNTLSEEKYSRESKVYTKTYYEDKANKVNTEYVTDIAGIGFYGKFMKYYDTGQKEVEGQYYSGDYFTKIRIGLWKWFNKDGTISIEDNYKTEIEFWPNGKAKIEGGLILNKNTKEWVRIGEWKWYKEDGSIMSTSKYD